MLILLLVWCVIGIALMALTIEKRLGSAGLPLAYFLALSLSHVPGTLLYIDGEELNTSAVITRIGTEQTLIGMACFLFGVVIAKY